jgi:hypothetical protein
MEVKNKPRDRQTEHAFILGSMNYTVANTCGPTSLPFLVINIALLSTSKSHVSIQLSFNALQLMTPYLFML